MTREIVERYVDAGRPVFLSWGEGTAATVLLVELEGNVAVSRYGSRWHVDQITEISPSTGVVSGLPRTGDGVRRS